MRFELIFENQFYYVVHLLVNTRLKKYKLCHPDDVGFSFRSSPQKKDERSREVL